jgi:hypothetical protein
MFPSINDESKWSWQRTLYYYAILFVGMIFITVGTVGIIRITLLNTVLTEIRDREVSTPFVQGEICDSDRSNVSMIKDEVRPDTKRSMLGETEFKKRCDEQTVKANTIWFKEQMLSALLLIIAPSIIILLNYLLLGRTNANKAIVNTEKKVETEQKKTKKTNVKK